MNFTTEIEHPKVGEAVYYYNPRVRPAEMFAGLVKKVSKTSITVLIPELHGIQGFHEGLSRYQYGSGWGYENPNNLITFTWRKNRKRWGEKGDGHASCCILFPDPEEAALVKGTFETLGGA